MSGILLFLALWAAFWIGPAYSAFVDAWNVYPSDRTAKPYILFGLWMLLFVAALALTFFAGRSA